MSSIKKAPGKHRKVIFTDLQMLQAQGSDKFKGKTHRDFIAWLFEHQHKCTVLNFDLLTYKYHMVGNTRACEVSGQIGLGIGFM